MPKRRRRWLVVLLLTVVALGLVISQSEPILIGMRDYLILPPDNTTTDVAYILGGGRSTRVDVAANLLRKGRVQRIVIPRSTGIANVDGVTLLSEQDLVNRMLQALGVDPSQIDLLTEPADSTEAEAIELARFLDDHPDRTATIITTDTHGRRCQWIFGRILGERSGRAHIVGAPGGKPKHWWRNADHATGIILEWAKLAREAIRL